MFLKHRPQEILTRPSASSARPPPRILRFKISSRPFAPPSRPEPALSEAEGRLKAFAQQRSCSVSRPNHIVEGHLCSLNTDPKKFLPVPLRPPRALLRGFCVLRFLRVPLRPLPRPCA